jgi:hypothetical protein
MDFFLGEVTRDHVDVDWFAWSTDAAALRTALLAKGYREVDGPPLEQQLDVTKDGEELSFAWLAEDGTGRVPARPARLSRPVAMITKDKCCWDNTNPS